MKLSPITSIFRRKTLPPLDAEPDYARMIVEQLPFMERLCRRASESPACSRSEAEIDNEADLLLTELLDHLKADDYRVLRDFRGGSKLTTYLTSVISNLVVDSVRKRRGRSRARERAAELGPVAERLHELVYGRGYTLADAHGHLVLSHGISESADELNSLLERIRGRDHAIPDGARDWPCRGFEAEVDGEIEVIVPDPARGAEETMIDRQRDRLRDRIMSTMLDALSGEERYMLRLRFPATDGEPPRSVREIAALLGQTEKAVDNRLRRLLMRCREMLLQKGISLDDLIRVGK